MKCKRTGCDNEAEVAPIIVIPCCAEHLDHDCNFEQEILCSAEVCRKCQELVKIVHLTNQELAILIFNMMGLVAHEPAFNQAYIRWIPITCEEYIMFQKLKDASTTLDNDTSSKLLH